MSNARSNGMVEYHLPADSTLGRLAVQVGHALGTGERRLRAAITGRGCQMAEELAIFAARASFEQLSAAAVDALKIRVLDSLGCAFAALDGAPVRALREQLEDFGAGRGATLIAGGAAAPDRAACYNTALTRYVDFMDNFMAAGETCHPCDNLGSVLAAAEYADATGRDFLAALAVAYQVQCRLVELTPITERGFDHTTHLAYSIAAGAGRALRLDAHRIANAIGMAGAVSTTLWVTRTGEVSQWKGLQSAAVAAGSTHHTFLAMRGVTGPVDVFDGVKGYMESIAGSFHVNWLAEDLEAVLRTSVKRYNAEVHSQSAIDCVRELQREHRFSAGDVDEIAIEIFDEAVEIIGGGEAGPRQADIGHKEEADHSLPGGDGVPDDPHAARRPETHEGTSRLPRVLQAPAVLGLGGLQIPSPQRGQACRCGPCDRSRVTAGSRQRAGPHRRTARLTDARLPIRRNLGHDERAKVAVAGSVVEVSAADNIEPSRQRRGRRIPRHVRGC